MERDFLGLGSKLAPITVKDETSDNSRESAHQTRGMMERSLSSQKVFLSFGASQQDRRRNDHLHSSAAFTSTSIPNNTFDQNRTTHYTSLQEVRMFPISSQQEKTTITTSMSEHAHFRTGGKSLERSPIMAPPLSVFNAPNSIVGTTDIRPIASPPPAQLTIFYAGSVSVYEDISPEKAQAIMLLAGNGPQAKPIPMPRAQNLVPHPPTMPPSLLPSTSCIVSETGSRSNEVTGLGPTTKATTRSLAFTPRNNQTNASNMGPAAVGLPQSRKASLARFLEKRKDRVINVWPYYVDNKSSADCRTPMSECASSSLSSSSAVRPI